jgi:hypothetical protein
MSRLDFDLGFSGERKLKAQRTGPGPRHVGVRPPRNTKVARQLDPRGDFGEDFQCQSGSTSPYKRIPMKRVRAVMRATEDDARARHRTIVVTHTAHARSRRPSRADSMEENQWPLEWLEIRPRRRSLLSRFVTRFFAIRDARICPRKTCPKRRVWPP